MRTESIALHSDWIIKYKIIDILHLEAMCIIDNALVKFNRRECCNFQYNYIKTDNSVLDDKDNEDESEITQFFVTNDVE